ncbi:adhesion G-protein coupled receptor G7-like [Clavelina lepadiformis]|uniref:adhesion G-protein coupled receptor G7-like n=1 Tax=Clavelina lepadiformis TaxID=159417 RepID=UPI004042806B
MLTLCGSFSLLIAPVNCSRLRTSQTGFVFVHSTQQNNAAVHTPRDNELEIVSVDVEDRAIEGLSNPVVIKHLSVNVSAGRTSNDEPFKLSYVNETCAFWNFSTNSWSTEGCCLVEGSNPPECRCNHLTNFAVLLAIYDIPDDVALSTTAGCSISVVFLAITLLLLIVPKHIRMRRHIKMLINMCLNLMLAYVIFLAGVGKRRDAPLCVAHAVMLHFFLLCTFCWMAAYAHSLYRSVVQVLRLNWHRYLTKMSAACYGAPLVIVAVNAAVTLYFSELPDAPPVCDAEPSSELAVSAMIADNMCWLHGNSLYFSFLLPVGLILTFNLIVFYFVIRNITCNRKKVSSTTPRSTIRQRLVAAVLIASSVGLVWLLGYFLMLSDDVIYFTIMNWLFTLATSIQGFCLFLLLCVHNGDVRDTWWPAVCKFLRCKCRRRAPSGGSVEKCGRVSQMTETKVGNYFYTSGS